MPVSDGPIIAGSTRLFAIVGDPIAQVRSPEMFNALFRGSGVDAVLLPVQVSAAALDAVLPALQRVGNLAGMVITVPHKIEAARHVARLGLHDVEPSRSRDLAEQLRRHHPDLSLDVAATVASIAAAPGGPCFGDAGEAARGVAHSGDCDLAVNATPLGMAPGGPLPFDPDVGRRHGDEARHSAAARPGTAKRASDPPRSAHPRASGTTGGAVLRGDRLSCC